MMGWRDSEKVPLEDAAFNLGLENGRVNYFSKGMEI